MEPLKLYSVTHYGPNPPSDLSFIKNLGPSAWSIHIKVRFTKKDVVRTTFWIEPPFWLTEKEKKPLRFKTTSYKEVCKWIKKHEAEINNDSVNNIEQGDDE